MTARKPLPSDLPPAFTVADAAALGVSRHRLDAADLRADFHGARAELSSPPLLALAALLSPGQAFWGPTAAKLWELPLPLQWSIASDFYVASSLGARMRRPGVIGARLRPRSIVQLHGVPAFDPVSTWLSLGRLLAPHDLTAVADRLVTGTLKKPALSTVDQLQDAVGDAGGARGIRALRCALIDARVGSWSRTETLLRLLIQRAGLPEPDLNAKLMLGGRLIYLDIAWVSLQVAIEYDGRDFHGDSERQWDIERHELLVDAGWIVVRVRARELFDQSSAVIARLVRRLAVRGVRVETIEWSKMPRFAS
jgi:very-short-patch-repair endonuclease